MITSVGANHEASIEWAMDPSDDQWDTWLNELGGHPLQSALWGSAKCRADGTREHRFVALFKGVPTCMARVEERKLPLFGKVAWIPKGPVYRKGVQTDALHEQLTTLLSQAGFLACLENPYRQEDVAAGWKYSGYPQTTLIDDLGRGRAAIWESLSPRVRRKITSLTKKGVVVQVSRDPECISEFYRLCVKTSQYKGFDLPGSEELMLGLFANKSDSPISAQLFLALLEGRLVAGYLTISTKESIHNIWSMVDRENGINGSAEFLVWSLLEWSIARKIQRYDQEGIDPQRNPSTYEFKKKFGGTETVLPGVFSYPIGIKGKLLLLVGRRLKKI